MIAHLICWGYGRDDEGGDYGRELEADCDEALATFEVNLIVKPVNERFERIEKKYNWSWDLDEGYV